MSLQVASKCHDLAALLSWTERVEAGEEGEDAKTQVDFFGSLTSLKYICVNVAKTDSSFSHSEWASIDFLLLDFPNQILANFRHQFHSQSASNYLDTDFDTEEECALHYPFISFVDDHVLL